MSPIVFQNCVRLFRSLHLPPSRTLFDFCHSFNHHILQIMGQYDGLLGQVDLQPLIPLSKANVKSSYLVPSSSVLGFVLRCSLSSSGKPTTTSNIFVEIVGLSSSMLRSSCLLTPSPSQRIMQMCIWCASLGHKLSSLRLTSLSLEYCLSLGR